MNWRNVFTVFHKELRDTLRDRRTLLSTFLIPLVAMPILMLGAGTVAYKAVSKAQAEVPTVMVLGGADSPEVQTALAGCKKIMLVPAAADWRQRIADKLLRAAV